jgi:hypothetical protein
MKRLQQSCSEEGIRNGLCCVLQCWPEMPVARELPVHSLPGAQMEPDAREAELYSAVQQPPVL